ncbi:hypothetical protein HKCCE2091_15040 [Rhodobacterales bacterium HKCCE2091]|nr:hypothetical protein [Rhodobacterales bacterium HKCCE2091]
MPGAELLEAQLQRASFFRSQIQGADLTMSQMQGAGLRGALMQGADLTVADMQGAFLREAQMQATYLWGTRFSNYSDFTDTTLRGAAARRLDDRTVARLREFWGEMFADGSVDVPDGERPAHWPTEVLFEHWERPNSPFHIEWHLWQSDPDAYVVPSARGVFYPPEDDEAEFDRWRSDHAAYRPPGHPDRQD